MSFVMAETGDNKKYALLAAVGLGGAALAYGISFNRTQMAQPEQNVQYEGLDIDEVNRTRMVFPPIDPSLTQTPGSGASQRRTSP